MSVEFSGHPFSKSFFIPPARSPIHQLFLHAVSSFSMHSTNRAQSFFPTREDTVQLGRKINLDGVKCIPARLLQTFWFEV